MSENGITGEPLETLEAQRAELALRLRRGEDGAERALDALEKKLRRILLEREREDLAAKAAAREEAEQRQQQAHEAREQARQQLGELVAQRADIARDIDRHFESVVSGLQSYLELTQRGRDLAPQAGIARDFDERASQRALQHAIWRLRTVWGPRTAELTVPHETYRRPLAELEAELDLGGTKEEGT